MVSNEYEQLSSEALEAARICANKYVLQIKSQKNKNEKVDEKERNLTRVTGTSSRLQAKKVSTSVSAPTLTMWSESTRCCLAPVPIDCRLE